MRRGNKGTVIKAVFASCGLVLLLTTSAVWRYHLLDGGLGEDFPSNTKFKGDGVHFHGRKLSWFQSEKNKTTPELNYLGGGSSPAECDDVHSVNSSEVCDFVNGNPECQNDEGFLSYTDIVYCRFGHKLLPLAITLLFLWWLFLFVGLAVTADDFFCPALKVISKTLRLSDNVAGVTFLAFGNGAPDIFSAIAAIGNAKNGDAGLAFGALFGAGVFVTCVVAGTIAIVCPFDVMQRPFLRDVIFYLAAVFWAFSMLWDKIIQQYEAIGFIVLYVVYVIVVICGRYVYQRHKRYNRKKLTADKTGIQQDDDKHGESGEGSPYNQSIEIQPDNSDELSQPITDDESLPLLGYAGRKTWAERLQPFREMLHAVNPINTEEWKDKKVFWKAYDIFKSPIQLLLLLTVPVVDEELDRANWCRYLQTFQLVLGPVFSTLATKVGFKVLFGVLPVWALTLMICALLALVVFCTSKNDTKPIYHPAFGFLGFLVAVVWIYCIANEVVNILQTFGVVFDISDAILGLTLLAWGNSVGDFIADTVMAKQGFPRMGISACFGGPMFNLLLGIGIPFTIQTAKAGGAFKLEVTLEEYILAGFLALSLIVSLVVVTCSWFRMSRPYGIILWVLYAVFLAVAILTETGVIHAAV